MADREPTEKEQHPHIKKKFPRPPALRPLADGESRVPFSHCDSRAAAEKGAQKMAELTDSVVVEIEEQAVLSTQMWQPVTTWYTDTVKQQYRIIDKPPPPRLEWITRYHAILRPRPSTIEEM
jgi:hypothetical protein